MSVPDVSRRSDLPPIRLAPRSQWGQGNPLIHEYCPRCRTNTIPKRHICLWCGHATVRRPGR